MAYTAVMERNRGIYSRNGTKSHLDYQRSEYPECGRANARAQSPGPQASALDNLKKATGDLHMGPSVNTGGVKTVVTS